MWIVLYVSLSIYLSLFSSFLQNGSSWRREICSLSLADDAMGCNFNFRQISVEMGLTFRLTFADLWPLLYSNYSLKVKSLVLTSVGPPMKAIVSWPIICGPILTQPNQPSSHPLTKLMAPEGKLSHGSNIDFTTTELAHCWLLCQLTYLFSCL